MNRILTLLLGLVLASVMHTAGGYERSSSGQLIAEKGKLTVSDDPNVTKRYQQYHARCLVDVQVYANGSRQETGYYKCASCRGTSICSVCNGQGYLGVSSYGTVLECTCRYTGRCYCAVGTGFNFNIGGAGAAPALFPGWTLAFHNYYDSNGRKISGENFARQDREERQAERKHRKDSQAKCSDCNSTGFNLSPSSSRPSSQLIGRYHSGGTMCGLCGSFTGHWHSKCTSCMGRLPVY